MMKMVLWVEDSSDAIHKVFDELPAEGLDEKLLEKYHIHRVDNLDDALTAINERDYDYYLLDIDLPECDIDNEDDAENKALIASFIENDPDKDNFDPLMAGQYLFKHLLPIKDISQLRIYSAHIEQTNALEKWVKESGLSIDWDEVVFDKASNSKQTAQAVKEWLTGVAKSPERILRHAMIEGCNKALTCTIRTIYTKQCKNEIKPENLSKHIRTIRDVVKALGPTFEHDLNKKTFYFSMLILLITSECQEQDSYNKKYGADLLLLMNVLDKVRNMHAHTQGDKVLTYSIQFVAFTFLVYLRARCDFKSDSKPFEKHLLHLISNKDIKVTTLSGCYDKLIEIFNDRYNEIKCTADVTDYRQLFTAEFDKYTYGDVECIRLFLFNFLCFKRAFSKGSGVGIELQMEGSTLVIKDNLPQNRRFTTSWYDDYFMAFYTIAFPNNET